VVDCWVAGVRSLVNSVSMSSIAAVWFGHAPARMSERERVSLGLGLVMRASWDWLAILEAHLACTGEST
jgi:hypothetical protein